jgi:hypothetical protein
MFIFPAVNKLPLFCVKVRLALGFAGSVKIMEVPLTVAVALLRVRLPPLKVPVRIS